MIANKNQIEGDKQTVYSDDIEDPFSLSAKKMKFTPISSSKFKG